MNKKVAILRGINVGGNRKILMADLKLLFEELGFSNIITYIQSGNVLFNSNTENELLADQIEQAITANFGFDVPVIVRSAIELKKAIDTNPFYDADADVNKLHLSFLKEKPTAENLQHTVSYNYEPDKFVIDGKEVFIFCENKYHESKLTNLFFEKKLKVGATTRNWKTVLKLMVLAQN